MSEFEKKLQAFLEHYESLRASEGGDDADDLFNKEFISLKTESMKYKEQNLFPAESGQLPMNKKKNRFKDILPFEYTRVQLHKIEGEDGSDYINANYIQGPDGNVTYIASQGPLPHTVNDFWRMIWYHQIEIVVMACREVELAKPKCQRYWPDVGESMFYGVIQVTTRHEYNISDDFITRELVVECQGEEQVVRHYHYTAWPDHGRPKTPDPIIRMVEMLNDHRKRKDIPVVIHCSAGCGRTGTIIAIDYARSMIMAENIPNDFNVYTIVQNMRRQRPAMVQAKDQYIFVYLAVAALVHRALGKTPQPAARTFPFEQKNASPQKSAPASQDPVLYANVNYDEDNDKPQLNSTRTNNNSTSNLVAPPRPSGGKLSPPLPTKPKPLARTSSAGVTRVTDTANSNHPAPPPKPVLKPEKQSAPVTLPKPEPRHRPPKIEEPVVHPRRTKESSPKHTQFAAPTDPHYSTPKQIPLPSLHGESAGSKNTSGSLDKGGGGSANSSILDTLMNECGDIFAPEELEEITNPSAISKTKPASADPMYSVLGEVMADEIPPEIPKRTLASQEFLIEPEQSPQDGIYEKPDLPSVVTTAPQPAPKPKSLHTSGLASLPPALPLAKARDSSPTDSSTSHNMPSLRPNSHDQDRPTKGKSLFSSFKLKEKERNVAEELTRSMPRARSEQVNSPNRVPLPANRPARKVQVNDKYRFPGEFGYGIRVGRPRGPRPIPSHWTVPSGLMR